MSRLLFQIKAGGHLRARHSLAAANPTMGFLLAPACVQSHRARTLNSTLLTPHDMPQASWWRTGPGAWCALEGALAREGVAASASAAPQNGTSMRVSELWVFPVKSMRGGRVAHASLTSEGLEGDRRVMVASFGGQLVTQRQQPRLATIEARIQVPRYSLAHCAVWACICHSRAVHNVSVWETGGYGARRPSTPHKT